MFFGTLCTAYVSLKGMCIERKRLELSQAKQNIFVYIIQTNEYGKTLSR